MYGKDMTVIVSQNDHITKPRAFWETGSTAELFDEVMITIALDSNCVCPFFNFFSILYPSGCSSSFPKFVNKRLGGTVGSTLQKLSEMKYLSRFGIVKQEPYDIYGDLPPVFGGWPTCVETSALLGALPVGKNEDDLILSLEECIIRRNCNRCDNGLPIQVVHKGKPVHDEFVLVLQILRAKLILNKTI